MIDHDELDLREMVSRPGRFEGAPQMAAYLDPFTPDETYGSVHECGLWVGRFGRRLLIEDSQGFVTYERHEDESAADLRACVLSGDTRHMSSVWSNYGHHFLTEDDDHVSCLRCGALYQLILDVDDDASHGAYVNAYGNPPDECRGADHAPVHGYPGERHCDGCDSNDDPCVHELAECNCISCDS